MSGDYTCSLQNTILQIIHNDLRGSEQYFKRITMANNADNDPAELYGTDGKIYYRKDGDLVGAELDAGGSSSLWEVSGANIAAVSNTPVILDTVFIKYDGSGADVDSDIAFVLEAGGGGGAHPYEKDEPI